MPTRPRLVMNLSLEWKEISATRRHVYFYDLLILAAILGNNLRNTGQSEVRIAAGKAKSELARFAGLTEVEPWNAPVAR